MHKYNHTIDDEIYFCDRNYTVIFHIGTVKTGTTYLQNAVFPHLFNNCNYQLGSYFEDFPSIQKDNLNFFSKEGWSSCCDTSKAYIRFEDFYNRLKKFDDSTTNIKIILCLRNPEAWIRSMYLQRLKNGYNVGTIDNFAKHFDNNYSFCTLIDSLSEYNILVLDYNDLLERPKNFIKAIANFSGVSLDISKNNILNIFNNKSDQNINLTPKTFAELKASQLFAQSKSSKFGIIRLFTGVSRKLFNLELITRDSMIRVERYLFPNSNKIDFELKDNNVKYKWLRDWEKAWQKCYEYKNVVVLEDMF